MTQLTNILSLPLIFIFFSNVKAQNSPLNTSPLISSQDSLGGFQPNLAFVVAVLSLVFALIFLLILYTKFCHREASGRGTAEQVLVGSRSRASGLGKTVIESLPFFRFSLLKGSREGLECSVCLSKFEDIEMLRLLPKCKHAFHIDCIDQWLEKHSTCPLCRQKVSEDDLANMAYSHSLRFLWNNPSELREESNVELYVEREEGDSKRRSSRFSIGTSFRKHVKEEELPIRESKESVEHEKVLHKFNHMIVVNDVVLMKNRWSNLSSSDLMVLDSEMLNGMSNSRFSPLDHLSIDIEEETEFNENVSIKFPSLPTTSDSKQKWECNSKVVNSIDRRSMSEIVSHPRQAKLDGEGSNSLPESNAKEEKMRRIWMPIARNTIDWFAARQTTETSRSTPTTNSR